ncbi:hypothetical protein J0B03_02400 [Alkalibacter rhizosphaerae]|uniref:Uncharacterized protein n=1 Tax=Alkalibacter rhizosphaerae TaxID=2815577 RepID=A0A974XFS7_9FIRM|nr:hypothetical protein [Alkalibacter rhizosphaerae]QSX08951.1 hypothetical protein J0B03_02400 [Alkalibacter rhizosphaerae]
MTLENLYRSSILPFRQHLLVSKGVFRSSLRILLYLAALPLISYSFMYIYIGDGTVESIMAMPQSIAFVIFFLNILIFMVLIPFIMTITQRFVYNKPFSFSEMLRDVGKRLLPLTLGFLLLGAGLALLFTAVLAVIPLFTSQTGFTLFSLLYFAVVVYVYLNILFWSHFVVLAEMNTLSSFRESRKVFKRHGRQMITYTLSLAFLSLIFLNGIAWILSALIRNAMAANVTLAFVQSIVLIFSQIMLTSFFMNFSLFGSDAPDATSSQS